MTDTSPQSNEHGIVDGGGAAPVADDPTLVAVRAAAAKLEMLSPETRETILGRMTPEHAERIRAYLASLTDRPHGEFSQDVAERRRLLHETANRVSARRTTDVDREVRELARDGARPRARTAGTQPVEPAIDPMDRLRDLHPAAIARAMQGERAEAWAIVLDRLDDNARAALQLYLDPSARAAIEDARARQAELAHTAPALLATVVAAIARTVVPRAMREHHQLLSTTPLAWTGAADGIGA